MAILAYDIGGSSIKYGVVSETGELSGQGKVKTPATLEEFYVAVDQIRRDCSTEGRGAGVISITFLLEKLYPSVWGCR